MPLPIDIQRDLRRINILPAARVEAIIEFLTKELAGLKQYEELQSRSGNLSTKEKGELFRLKGQYEGVSTRGEITEINKHLQNLEKVRQTKADLSPPSVDQQDLKITTGEKTYSAAETLKAVPRRDSKEEISRLSTSKPQISKVRPQTSRPVQDTDQKPEVTVGKTATFESHKLSAMNTDSRGNISRQSTNQPQTSRKVQGSAPPKSTMQTKLPTPETTPSLESRSDDAIPDAPPMDNTPNAAFAENKIFNVVKRNTTTENVQEKITDREKKEDPHLAAIREFSRENLKKPMPSAGRKIVEGSSLLKNIKIQTHLSPRKSTSSSPTSPRSEVDESEWEIKTPSPSAPASPRVTASSPTTPKEGRESPRTSQNESINRIEQAKVEGAEAGSKKVEHEWQSLLRTKMDQRRERTRNEEGVLPEKSTSKEEKPSSPTPTNPKFRAPKK